MSWDETLAIISAIATVILWGGVLAYVAYRAFLVLRRIWRHFTRGLDEPELREDRSGNGLDHDQAAVMARYSRDDWRSGKVSRERTD